MAVKVLIPTPLQNLTKGQSEIEVKATTIEELIEELESQYAGIKERLCDEKGCLRRFINVYLNGEDIRFLDGEKTKIEDGSEVSIIPAIAGG